MQLQKLPRTKKKDYMSRSTTAGLIRMVFTRYRPVSSRSVILRVKESQDVQDPKGIPDVSEHVIEQRISILS